MLVFLLALFFNTKEIVDAIQRNFPGIDQMEVLDPQNGTFIGGLPCKKLTLNDGTDSTCDLVVGTSLDRLDRPNGCILLKEQSLKETLQSLKNGKKNGKIFSRHDSHLVIWRSEIDNRLKSQFIDTKNRITYAHSGGRLGDCLLAYLHGKWASMYSGIPLHAQFFVNADKFSLIHLESNKNSFKTKKFPLPHLNYFLPNVEKVMYTIPYFPDDEEEYQVYRKNFGGAYFYIDWQDPLFKKEIKRCLHPTFKPKKISRPEGMKSVAIHMRMGGNYETFEVGHYYYPLKFPPFNYYCTALKQVLALYPDEPLYLYLFTDDTSPGKLLERLKSEFPREDLIFDCCQLQPGVDDVDEFFAMSEFDILIRGMSNFSLVSGFYGDPELILAATKSQTSLDKTSIEETTLFYHFGP